MKYLKVDITLVYMSTVFASVVLMIALFFGEIISAALMYGIISYSILLLILFRPKDSKYDEKDE